MKLTTDRHEASCGLSATAELLVYARNVASSKSIMFSFVRPVVSLSVLMSVPCQHWLATLSVRASSLLSQNGIVRRSGTTIIQMQTVFSSPVISIFLFLFSLLSPPKKVSTKYNARFTRYKSAKNLLETQLAIMKIQSFVYRHHLCGRGQKS